MEKVREKLVKSIVLSINVNDIKENTIIELRKLLEKNKGNCACYFDVVDAAKRKKFQTRKFTVEANDSFIDEVKKMLGPQSVKVAS